MGDLLISAELDPIGIAIVGADIHALTGRLRSFREPLNRSIREVMIPSFRANFDHEGRPEHWAALSPVTIDIRAALGFGAGPILNRTGKLKQVMAQINIWTVTSDEAKIDNLPDKVKYGQLHQNGYGSTPERPFALIQDNDEDKIEEIFEEHFLGGIVIP